ncbi:MAG TPA: hypothetical protein VKQ09_06900 [Sphingomonas sp.]|nr:hypothetical protein [Sphingomonas sp.]
MLPIRHSSIFKSRWIALLWAGGILWGAIEFVGDQPRHDSPTTANDDTAATQTVINAFDGAK